jgi:ligand-binding sensor domain-containing protein
MADYVQEIWEAREDGLPHPTVTSIVQTRDRYLWVGTYAGLARFDGLTFHIPSDAGPGNVLRDHVRHLAEGGDGSLWVGTRHEGLARVKDGTVHVFTMKQGLRTNNIGHLAATRDGTAWTQGSPLTSITAAGEVRHHGAEDGLLASSITALFADTDGALWVGGPRGSLTRYDGARFETVRWSKEENPPGILALTRDRAGHLWLGTGRGLYELEGERTADVVAHLRFGEGMTTLSSGPLGVWAAGSNTLVAVDAGGTKTYDAASGLLHESVNALRQDDQGSIWLGTRVGMAKLRPRMIRSYTRVDGLPSKVATCVLESRNGDLWVGTTGGLGRRRDGQWSTFGRREGLPDVSIRGLAEGPDGTIWIATVDGLARYADGRFTVLPGAERPYLIRSLAVDGANRVWVGTYEHGIDRLENGSLTRVLPRRDGCAQTRPNFILPIAGDDVWVGGSAALLHLAGGRVECLSDAKDPARDDVRYIAPAAEGGFWIGTIGGLGRITAAGKAEALPGPRAPFNIPNYAVLDDGRGSLWCSTPQGLFQVRKEDLLRAGGLAPARGFGVGDGLASSVMTADGQPSAWRGRDGRLYFTSADGVVVVEPQAIEALPAPPPVYIERLVADGRPVVASQRLPAGTHDVEVHFTAVSFHVPELVRYRYQLEGFDAGWRDGENHRVASYTNLPPRHYRFRVMAADHTGVWNEPGASLQFELPPRLHQTLWFRVLGAAGLLVALVAAHRFRLAHVHAQAAELQREVDQSLASIQLLRGLLPICAWCRRVRQDSGYWQQLEVYVMERSDARFTQSLCADCAAAELAAGTAEAPELTGS